MTDTESLWLDPATREACATDPDHDDWHEVTDKSSWANFIPRADDPANFDEQHGFCFNKDRVSFLVGGNAAGCLGGEQEVYDPVADVSRPVSEIDGSFHVVSWNPHTCSRVIGGANRPKVYGVADLYEVTLSTGETFIATLGHKMLLLSGEWLSIDRAALSSSNTLRHLLTGGDLPYIVSTRFLRHDEYWDFTVWPHHNYELAGVIHSNTTECAAYKTALFLLRQQPPPRKDTPFWIISNTYEQVCGVCWCEKLHGHQHIPECEVQWDRVRYLNTAQGWPASVPLLPWPTERGGDPNKNWLIEFKSYEQGRRALQARSIGGFWFYDQFTWYLFIETLRGCREYMFRGGQFSEFTPIEPVLCLELEKLIDKHPEGWRFYRCNTEMNKPNLAEGWYEDFFASVSDEMMATRMTGELAGFEGVIYPSFHREIHVVDEIKPEDIPRGVHHYRGIDWGASEEHPHASGWGYRDGKGCWTIYDEYWSADQSLITLDHAEETVRRSRYWGWPYIWRDTVKMGKLLVPGESLHHHESFADPSRPGEINEFGLRGVPTFSASNDVFKGIDCIRSLLKVRADGEPMIKISSRCKHLIEELRKYRWKKGRKPTEGLIRNPQVAAPEPLKRDDDSVDWLRYMIYSAERGRGAVPGSMSHREFAKRKSVQKSEDRDVARVADSLTRGYFKPS